MNGSFLAHQWIAVDSLLFVQQQQPKKTTQNPYKVFEGKTLC